MCFKIDISKMQKLDLAFDHVADAPYTKFDALQ